MRRAYSRGTAGRSLPIAFSASIVSGIPVAFVVFVGTLAIRLGDSIPTIEGGVSSRAGFCTAFVASNTADRFRKQLVSVARTGRLGFLIAGGAFYFVATGIAVADVAAGQHFARRTRRIVTHGFTAGLFTFAASSAAGFSAGFQRSVFARCRERAVSRRASRSYAIVVADCVAVGRVARHRNARVARAFFIACAIAVGRATRFFTFTASSAAGFSVGVQSIAARTRRRGRAVPRRASGDVAIVACAVRSADIGGNRRIAFGRVAVRLMSHFRAGFQNAPVVDAFLIVGALAVGCAVSRNRRTRYARAVRTGNTGADRIITRAARCSVSAVDFRAGFQNTAVVDAFLVSAALAVGRAVSGNRRAGHARAVRAADAR